MIFKNKHGILDSHQQRFPLGGIISSDGLNVFYPEKFLSTKLRKQQFS
ncbi:hypothetical protein Awo_c27720 [Acetobacterium woodii DSM 1030]|uniref:Uncharacterized protein n=1 Tax=Acetobacterium woodii (strain ATCC 29683 / DSM 1030 / JCM 2381 / KCTC 1655 / WB1) TaxID=931626 RepID=H6LG47_ACEWD|nr:hypothetical protein Awo_c27720 [Acetobacterium woodii DSM 1030]